MIARGHLIGGRSLFEEQVKALALNKCFKRLFQILLWKMLTTHSSFFPQLVHKIGTRIDLDPWLSWNNCRTSISKDLQKLKQSVCFANMGGIVKWAKWI
jgi:hypothetical protein